MVKSSILGGERKLKGAGRNEMRITHTIDLAFESKDPKVLKNIVAIIAESELYLEQYTDWEPNSLKGIITIDDVGIK